MIFFYSKKKVSNFDIQLHKQWDEFATSLEKNKKVGTYDINFDENLEFSEYYLINEKELPSFLILDHQTISLFKKDDIIAAFNNENSVSEIKNAKSLNSSGNTVFHQLKRNYKSKDLVKAICPDFEPKSANYPALVFHSSDIQHCKKIRKLVIYNPEISDHLYFSNEVGAGHFYFYHNETDFIIQKLSKSKISKIIREYTLFPFSNFWSIPVIREIKKRRVAFIVYSSDRDFPLYDSNLSNVQTENTHDIKANSQIIENEKLRNMIYNISNYFWRDIVFNKITLKKYNVLEAKMNESDTPFIFVTNKRKSKFIIIKNISISNQENIIKKLKQIRRGLYDNEMSLTFFPILSVFYENTRTLKNTLCFTLVALVVVTFTTYIIVKKASFCINPQNEIVYRRRHIL